MPDFAKITFSLVFLAICLAGCAADNRSDVVPDAGDTDTGSETETDPPDTSTECEGIDFPVAGHPPTMMFVLDRSGSMGGATIGETPWTSCSAAITDVSAHLDYQIHFGLLMYPLDDAEEPCLAPEEPEVPIAPINSVDIAETLGLANLSPGGTPTAAALQQAYEHLVGLETDGGLHVILATDGAPNCSSDTSLDCDTCIWTGPGCYDPLVCLDDQGTYAKVQEYHDFWGIQTYVIGVGGVWETWDEVLSTIAYLGGTEDYYPAQTDEGPDELIAALQGIAAEATECTFDVDWSSLGWGVSQDPDMVNVLADEEIVPRSDDCSFAGGWHWLDEDTIELCPDLCEDYRWGDVAVIHASFGCETIVE